MLWSGFAPVTAVVVLHLLFKHVLRVPSPFKPSGALAYAGAIGGIGAAAGAGFDRLLARARYQRRIPGAAGRRWRSADTARTHGRGRGSNAGSMPMRPPAPKQLDAGRSGAPPPALTAAELRGDKRSLHTGQHLPPDRLDRGHPRVGATAAHFRRRTAWQRFFEHNRTDPEDRGDWGNLAAAARATGNAYLAKAGRRTVQATVGRGRYQLSHAKQGLDRGWHRRRTRRGRTCGPGRSGPRSPPAGSPSPPPLSAHRWSPAPPGRCSSAGRFVPEATIVVTPDSGSLKRSDPTTPAPTTAAEAEK